VGIEKLGIPCVSIVQEGFVAAAKSSGEAFQLRNLTLAVTPYVFTSLNAQQTRQAVDLIIEDIIIGLTNPLTELGENVVRRIAMQGSQDEIIEFIGEDYKECLEKMNDKFLDWGWGDGFPLIPPTEEAVKKILGGTKRPPDDTVVEKFVPGMARASVKNIAINAVMAGCKTDFLPVVIAAVEAMHDLAINLRICTMSTGPHAPLFIVNGPIAPKLHINSGLCALGPAGPKKLSFPNVVIGRAVRLILMNVGNAYPGIMDQDTIGSPAKFSMVIAENESANPWEPYHVEKGFNLEESTISCCYGHSLIEMGDLVSDNAEGLMNTFARHIKGIGQISITYFKPMILMAPDHAMILDRDGWTKDDVRQYLYLHCRISAEEYRRSACVAPSVKRKWIEAADSKAMVPLYEKPEDIQIVVVGGMSGKSAAYAAGYPSNPHLIRI
jgi:hypothetical protein